MKKPSPKPTPSSLKQLKALEAKLRAAAWAAPEPGFAQRWQANWRREQTRMQRRRDGQLLLASSLTLAGLLGWVGWWAWELFVQQPISLSGVVEFFVSLSALLWTVLRVLVTMLSLVPLPVWYACSAGAFGLLILWLALYQPAVLEKELQ